MSENRVARQVRAILDSLANPFERLVFVASLRHRYTRQYVHGAWADVSSSEEVHAALSGAHRNVFESTADLPLAILSVELRKYFNSLCEVELRAATLWLETEPYYELIPDGCSSLSRKFFVSQVRFALELLVKNPEWSHLQLQPTLP